MSLSVEEIENVGAITEPDVDRLREYSRLVKAGAPLTALLPLLFQLKGKPFSLDWSHFMFEPMYNFANMPRQLLWRTGRQVSKCVSLNGNTKIYLASGRPVSGAELVVGQQVLAVDETNGKTASGRVKQTMRMDDRPLLRVSTRLGALLDVAETHPLLTSRGWIPAKDLKPGDRVAHIRSGAAFGTTTVDPSRVAVTAYMLGDGCCGRSGNLSFTKLHPETLADFLSWLPPDACTICSKRGTETKSVRISRVKCGLAGWLREDALWGKGSADKFVPAWVWDLSEQQLTLFLSRLWATDGSIRPAGRTSYNVSYASISEQLVSDVKSLLLKYSVLTSIALRWTTVNGLPYKYFILRVEGRESQERFLTTFTVPGKPRISLPCRQNSNRDTLPADFFTEIARLGDQLPADDTLYANDLRRSPKYAVGRYNLERYLELFELHRLDTSTLRRAQRLMWDTVERVESLGTGPCWDIEVETHHTYILDGIVSHNSTNLACSQVLLAALIPHLNLMTITPLQEQIRKFSANYVKPFITTSPFRSVLLDGGSSTDAVLQRRVNTSTLFYMYSSGNTNRVRGIATDALVLDEVQDLDHSDLPILEANMSASPWKLMRFAGTPKTFDNTIQLLWEDSSQAHWHIPCMKCGHVNRASVDGDLLKMIGVTTLTCAKCSTDDRPIALDSRAGYWLHDFGERMTSFPGYHVPQPILPMHYTSPRDWQILREFQAQKPKYAFYNEILGESYDAGSKLVTREELIGACQAEPCRPEAMPSGEYVAQCLGIDWGGRGKERTSDAEDFISNTAFALAGLRSDSRVEVKWLHKVSYEVDMSHETEMAVNVAVQSNTSHIALDYGGQGNVQEQQLRAHGWPQHAILPFTYTVMTPNKPIVFFNASKKPGVRVSLMLDKPRSLLLLCELIKRGWVILPKSEEWMTNHLLDFMNIYEESMDNPNGSPRRLVKRMSRRTDDIVHAINFAVMGLFRMTSAWPQITSAFVTGWNTETSEADSDQ